MPVQTLALTLGLLLAGETAAGKPPAGVPVQLSPLGLAKDGIRGLAFSPDGKTVAGGTFEGRVLLWDRASGKELCRVRLCPEGDENGGFVFFLAFAPDGKKLAGVHDPMMIGDERARVGLWEITGDRQLRALRTFRAESNGTQNRACQVTFSRDGKLLAIGEPPGTIRLWDVDTGRERLRFQGGVAVSFAPDGRTMTSVSHDGMIYHWAVGTNRLIDADQPTRRMDFLHLDHVTFGPAGRFVAVGDGTTILLKEGATGRTVRRLESASWGGPVSFSADDRTLAVSEEKGVVLVETATGKEVALVHSNGACAFSPDGRSFAWSDGDATTVESMPVTGTHGTRKRPTAPEGPDVALKAELTVNRRTNVLDLGGLTAEEFSREACFGYVPTPTVDLTLTVRNTGTKPLAIRPDLKCMTFRLVGPGALTLSDEGRQTGPTAVQPPDPITLAAGPSHSCRITSLGEEWRAYWLLPGEYSLHARVLVDVVEPTKGKQEAGGGRYESLECPPVKLTVAAPGGPSADLLEKTVKLPPLGAVVVSEPSEMLEFRHKLNRPTRVEFEDATTLQEALTYIGERYDLDVRIDEAAFKKAGRGRIGEAKVKVKPPDGVSLNGVLGLVLEDLDAGYEIRKETLWVVPQARPQSLAERLHPADNPWFLRHIYRRVTLRPGVKAGTALAEALRDLGERLDLTILLDRKAFERAGIKDIDKRPVELGEQVDVRRSTVVRKLVQQAGAAVVTRERVVLVVPGRDGTP